MKNKGKLVFSILMYCVAIFILVLYFFKEICFDSFSTSEVFKLVVLGLSCLFLYFGGVLLAKYKNSKIPLKVNLWIFFVLYLFLLFTLTFFDKSWGRHMVSFSSFSIDGLKKYISVACNFVPFKTILLYIKQFDSMYSTRQVLLNLFGNIAALMPCAFFLRVLFKKENNFKIFLIHMILIILGIEVTQLLTASGRFDVDDLILNLFGAVIVYFIMNIRVVDDIIGNVLFLNNNKLEKKAVLKLFTCCFIVVCLALALISYRNILYNRNMRAHNYKYNPTLDLVTKVDSCSDDKSFFYEDDLYKYYLKCFDINNVYILVNNKDKYLISDLIDDTSKYNVGIQNILHLFDREHVDYIRVEKYDTISISYDVDLTDSVTIKNQDILDFKYGVFNYNDNDTIDVDIFLIPYRKGVTTLKIDFINEVNNKIKYSVNYNILVDDNLNVFYEEIMNQ